MCDSECISGRLYAGKVSGLELACIASLLLLFILLPIVNLIGKVLHLNEVETMSIYYSNSGNLIVPLVAFMLGDKWVFYACVFMGLQTIFFWTHCKKVLSHEKGFNLKKIFFNINIITIIIAITLFLQKYVCRKSLQERLVQSEQ